MNDTLYNKEAAFPVAMQYGFIIAGINIIWSLIGYLFGVNQNPSILNTFLGIGVFIISVVLLVQGIRKLKSMQSGFLTFGEGFKVGALISLVGSLVYSIFWYIYLALIDTDFLQTIKDQSMQNMSEEEIEQAGGMLDTIFSAGTFSIFAFFMIFIGGLIVGAIVSAVIQQKPPEMIN